MSKRLNNILQHITVTKNDGDVMRNVKQRVALASLSSQLTVSDEHLKQLIAYMLHEMVEGAEGRESTIRMLPSYVYKSKPSSATGVFYALDLGGTNFRVLRASCNAGVVVDRVEEKFVIPPNAVNGEAVDLFDFIANSVKTMMRSKAPEDLQRTVPLGFTFSFPTDQKSINRGNLIKWTKGFSTKGVEGSNVVELLQKSLERVKVKVNVVALCNDTVGTLITQFFQDPDVKVGAILGTGSNACYFDHASTVTKDPLVSKRGDVLTPINMECGNFDSKYRFVLPITVYDEEIDTNSNNSGNQALEKLVSGMYQGEVARRIIVHLSQLQCLPSELASAMSTPWCFTTKYMGMISADRMPGLQFTRQLLRRLFKVDVKVVSELEVITHVCCLVRNRAAQMSAMFCSTPLVKTQAQGRATIAVDGSVYEKLPSFRRVFQENIRRMLGPECDVHTVLTKDGSGLGAAFISAMVQNDK